jgi:hypothetical protein
MAKKTSKKTNEKTPKTPAQSGSTLLLDEFFEQGDSRFLQELFACQVDQKFKSFSKKWYQDDRPFAREMLYQYIEDGCDRPHHRLLVKRLFKFAEGAKDSELMGRFLVTFDRLNKRKLEEVIEYTKGKEKKSKRLVQVQNPQIKEMFLTKKESKQATKFTHRTRLYLQRRAWRYFRFLGFRDKTLYWQEIKKVLLRYQDDHLLKPEQLLDSWGLLHALYHGSSVLNREPRGVILRKKKSLDGLIPAPFCPDAWEEKFDELFLMLLSCQGRTVRSFLRALLTREYKEDVKRLSVFQIKRLLMSQYEDAQEWGSSLLRSAKGLDLLSVNDWLSLLQIQNATIAPVMAELAEKYLKAQSLSLAQCIAVAKAKVANVAQLGLSWCLQKPAENDDDFQLLLQLGNAEVVAVREEAVSYLLGEIASASSARSEHLRELIDSKQEDTRTQALAMMQNDTRFRDSLALWGALSESPYDDVRGHLLKHLKDRETTFTPGTLRAVWASALLAISKGSRTKQTVLRQLAERIVQNPEEAGEICSLLAIALRSVRAPERRGALAVLAKAAWQKPALRKIIQQKLPELTLFEEEAA